MISKKDNTRSPLIGAKNILYMFIEGQTHFGMPGYAKVSLALSRTNLVVLYSDSNTTSEHAPQVEKNILILYAKQPMEITRDKLHTEG